ncbi:NAD(+) diphosphatase [Nocardioides cavernaquae]|uniref:NAD(+) diphosphatase n=1 Tax=Nocardioides cavernaquae TaxID=2321396 RepID=UPI001EE55077|nr:NAD(+) diphosphatase [Nocardioides cavernaquae]
MIRERSDNDQPATGPKPTDSWAHDRLAHRRDDEAWLAGAWADPATRVVPLSGGRVYAVEGRPQWLSPAGLVEALPGVDVTDGVRVLLGERDGVARFALHVQGAGRDATTSAAGSAPRPPEDASAVTGWVGLRSLGLHLMQDIADARLLFHAVGIGEWLERTRFCARCGGTLTARQSGHVQVCDSCGREQFPRIEPAVIMLITQGEPGSPDERCLLGSGLQWGPTRFSTLAGFAEPGEALEDAVRREVFEEAGVRVGRVEWFASQPWPFPSSLMLGFTGRAISTEITIDPSEIADARWFTRAELKAQAESGEISLPTRGISISRTLIESWYGGPLPGSW